MAKYSKEIVQKICSLISKDSYTIEEISKMVSISKETYHSWARTKPDFMHSIKKAKGEFNEMVIMEAQRSLLKKVKGYSETETKTVYIPGISPSKPKIKEQVTTKKHYQPDTGAIIFTLINKDPENWKQRQTTDTNVNINQKVDELNSEQLDSLINEILK